jgi:putative transposase
MREVKSSSGFAMNAYVIMDDHFHWLIKPGEHHFSSIMQSVKPRFVHRYKKAIDQKNNATLWQRRFWDHVIRNSEDLHRHMDYIYYNPVKHRYVLKPLDYKWSSFNTHVKMGNYAANWGTGIISEAVHAMNLE